MGGEAAYHVSRILLLLPSHSGCLLIPPCFVDFARALCSVS